MDAAPVAVIIATFVLLGTAGWRVWGMFRPGRSLLDNPALFFLLVCGTLAVLHWPEITWPHDADLDESQMLAQGMRYLAHPIPWRDVDGTTSGPLNSLLLSVPIFFGAPVSHLTARLVLWVLQCLTMLFLYLALRKFGSRAEAQFVLLPTIFFYAFTIYAEFALYSSEALPVLLLSISTYLLAQEWVEPKISMGRLFALGCLAGALPFAKLQALPVAAFNLAIVFILCYFKYWRAGLLRTNWWRAGGALCLGMLLLPALILGVVIANRAFYDFWQSYIVAASSYSSQESLRAKFASLDVVLYSRSDFKRYFFSASTVLVLFLLIWRGRVSRLGWLLFWPMAVVVANVAVTLFCLLAAGKPFYHYTFLLVPPLAMLFGMTFFGAKKILTSGEENSVTVSWVSPQMFLVGYILIFGIQYSRVPLYLKHIHGFVPGAEDAAISPVSNYARSISQPGDMLSVWGWMPTFYIETGLMPATRDAICHYIISKGPYQNYYRSRYLKDLELSHPAIFIDAVSGGMFQWDWKGNNTHESFPELAKFIDENYSLWMSVHLTNAAKIGSPVRLYVIKERAKVLKLSPSEVFFPAGSRDFALDLPKVGGGGEK
jgi:hypothetical protein